MFFVRPITSLTAQVSALVTQIATMNKVVQPNSEAVAVVSTNERSNMEKAHYVKNRGYGEYRGNQFSNNYHPGMRNHENFSYANNKNVSILIYGSIIKRVKVYHL